MATRIGTIWLPEECVPNARVFAHPVRGNCLAGDGIRDGDVIVIDPDEPVADGDIAVVEWTWNGQRTRVVKHVWRHDQNLFLIPSNPDYEPLIVRYNDEPVIVGKVIRRIRSFSAGKKSA